MSRKKKKRTAGDVIRYIIMAAALCVFVFSAVQLAGIFLEYREGTEEYDRIREYVEQPVEQEEEDQALKGEATQSETAPGPICGLGCSSGYQLRPYRVASNRRYGNQLSYCKGNG